MTTSWASWSIPYSLVLDPTAQVVTQSNASANGSNANVYAVRDSDTSGDGKFVCAMQVNAIGYGAFLIGWGVGADGQYGNEALGSYRNDCIGWEPNGNVRFANGTIGTVAPYSAGDICYLALYRDRASSTWNMWFGKVVGGVIEWNDDPTANPATNTGAISIGGTIQAFGVNPYSNAPTVSMENGSPFGQVTLDAAGALAEVGFSMPSGYQWFNVPPVLTFNPAKTGSSVALSSNNTRMDISASKRAALANVGIYQGKYILGFNNIDSWYGVIGVANPSALINGPTLSGETDGNGAIYAEYSGSGSFLADTSAVSVTGFGQPKQVDGYLAIDANAFKFYIYINGLGWGPGNPDAGTGGYDISSLSGDQLFPYFGGDGGTIWTLNGNVTGVTDALTFEPWGGPLLLSDVLVSNTTWFDNAHSGESPGAVTGYTGTLSLTDPSGYFQLVGGNLSPLGNTPAGTYYVDIVETNAGASNSPHTTTVAITITAAPPIRLVWTATGTNTATAGVHKAGDLFVGGGFRDGNTTGPSLATGWTSVLIPAGANTCSERVAKLLATTSSHAINTWTNATSVAVALFRPGVGYALDVGASTSNSGSSTTVTYGALTLQDTSGRSFVLCFGGHRSTNTNLQNAPTGCSNIATNVDATDEVALHLTTSGVSSWTSKNVSVGGTSSGWFTAAVEIKATPTGATGTIAGVATVTGVGVGVAVRTGTINGVATVTGVIPSAGVDGTSNGSSTANGVGVAVAVRDGTIAGVASTSGVGVAVAPVLGTSNGLASAAGEGLAVAPRSGSSSGVATATGGAAVAATGSSNALASASGVGVAVAPRDGSAAGVASTSGLPVSVAERSGTIAGSSSVTAVVLAVAPRSSTVAGVATTTGDSLATAPRDGSAAGVATVVGGSITVWTVTGSIAGGATVYGEVDGSAGRVGTAAGSSTATGVAIAVWPVVGTAAGVATVTGALPTFYGLSAGSSTATGVGVAIAVRTGTSSGLATAQGEAIAAAPRGGLAQGQASTSGQSVGVAPRDGLSEGYGSVAGQVVWVATRSGNIAGYADVVGYILEATVTPLERSFLVPAERRWFSVDVEARSMAVASERRELAVPADARQFSVAAEERALHVDREVRTFAVAA